MINLQRKACKKNPNRIMSFPFFQKIYQWRQECISKLIKSIDIKCYIIDTNLFTVKEPIENLYLVLSGDGIEKGMRND